MLIDMIMYECMENLLQDKTDEENLECLCKLLTAIGKELEAKANDKVWLIETKNDVFLIFFLSFSMSASESKC
jgi:translation initiation factor 4G